MQVLGRRAGGREEKAALSCDVFTRWKKPPAITRKATRLPPFTIPANQGGPTWISSSLLLLSGRGYKLALIHQSYILVLYLVAVEPKRSKRSVDFLNIQGRSFLEWNYLQIVPSLLIPFSNNEPDLMGDVYHCGSSLVPPRDTRTSAARSSVPISKMNMELEEQMGLAQEHSCIKGLSSVERLSLTEGHIRSRLSN